MNNKQLNFDNSLYVSNYSLNLYNISKEKNIDIIDNFFSDDIVIYIKSFFNNNFWINNCIKYSNIDSFGGDEPFFRLDLNEETFFTKKLKTIIERKLDKKFNLNRVYAVSQFYEQDSNYHIDSICKKSFTFCYYINTSVVDEETKGYLFIKIPEKHFLLAIEPFSNRGILFPSHYIHKGTGINNGLRICIAWKFTISNFVPLKQY